LATAIPVLSVTGKNQHRPVWFTPVYSFVQNAYKNCVCIVIITFYNSSSSNNNNSNKCIPAK